MQTLVFLIHMGLGTLSLVFCMAALGKHVFSRSIDYRSEIRIIGLTSLFALISGVGLFLIQNSPSFLNFCARIGLYLIVVGGTELFLYTRLQKRSSLGEVVK